MITKEDIITIKIDKSNVYDWLVNKYQTSITELNNYTLEYFIDNDNNLNCIFTQDRSIDVNSPSEEYIKLYHKLLSEHQFVKCAFYKHHIDTNSYDVIFYIDYDDVNINNNKTLSKVESDVKEIFTNIITSSQYRTYEHIDTSSKLESLRYTQFYPELPSN